MNTKIAITVSLLFAQLLTAQNSNKIIITGSRFTYPLVEKWIAEYQKSHPEATFKINPRGGTNADSANLIINAHELSPEEIRPGYKVVNISRYSILPVSNSQNSLSREWAQSGIKKKDIAKLFFEKWDFTEEENQKNKKKYKHAHKLALYTRQQQACAPTTFARHYGYEQKDILGKGIVGDDKHLLDAVLRDSNGITYNNLGLIYDLKTRKQRTGLAVIPVDLNANGTLEKEEQIYENLDELVAKLENEKPEEIAIGNVNISFPEKVDAANKHYVDFVNWVLTDGQQYLHAYGFLNLPKNDLTKQIDLFNQFAKN